MLKAPLTQVTKPMITLKVNETLEQFRLITRADVNFLPGRNFSAIEVVELMAIFRDNVIFDEFTSAEKFYVVGDLSQPLLGWPTTKALNVLFAINSVKERFSTALSGLKKMKDPYQIYPIGPGVGGGVNSTPS